MYGECINLITVKNTLPLSPFKIHPLALHILISQSLPFSEAVLEVLFCEYFYDIP